MAPRPSDWGPQHHITGYWWPPAPADFVPPPDLADFLAAGPPPVFVGFGSTATRNGAQLAAVIAQAVTRAGVRVIVQSGWAGLSSLDPERGITVGPIPYEWLFPRTAAVVHHAGAGTTGAALRAGIPSIPVPGIMDQPYWSQRLVHLGVAPEFRRRRDLDADWLAGAITSAIEGRYADRARELSGRIATEDGAGVASRLIERMITV